MHKEARAFTRWAKQQVPNAFDSVDALDAGGGDINGNNKGLFTNIDSNTYVCNDVGPAPNATHVCKTAELPFADGSFDTVVSTECFEHDPEYAESLQKIMRLLRNGGTLAFTCATTGRAEHGTRRTSGAVSWGTRADVPGFPDYYKNLTVDDVVTVLDMSQFSEWQAYCEVKSCDLYFIGVKRGGPPGKVLTGEYKARRVKRVYPKAH
jgi:SAM-dependent methyltransferase